MNTHAQTKAIGADVSQLATDVRALVQATANVAGEKIGGIRQRISDALDHEMALYGRVRNKALHGTHAADEAMHRHPYPAVAIGIGLGVGLGAAIGYLLKHWGTSLRK